MNDDLGDGFDDTAPTDGSGELRPVGRRPGRRRVIAATAGAGAGGLTPPFGPDRPLLEITKARTRSRRGWPRALIAACAVLIVLAAAATGTVLIKGLGVPTKLSAYGTGPGPAGSTGHASPGDQQLRYGDLPRPAPGWRWVSWRNVAVQVPQSWPYGNRVHSDWCAATDREKDRKKTPDQPFVAMDDTDGIVMDIRCRVSTSGSFDTKISPAPDRLWRPYVAFATASGADVTRTHKSWQLSSRTVGDVQVQVLSSPSTAKLTGRILASARTFTVDQNGCPASSPIQANAFRRPEDRFDVTTLKQLDAISICQYAEIGTGRPGLSASRLLSGQEAQQQLEAVQSAPAGGGPDRPQDCVSDDTGDTAVVLRLHVGTVTHDLYLYYGSCRGNGFDDGSTLRELTQQACSPLFAKPPIQLSSGIAPVFRRCLR